MSMRRTISQCRVPKNCGSNSASVRFANCSNSVGRPRTNTRDAAGGEPLMCSGSNSRMARSSIRRDRRATVSTMGNTMRRYNRFRVTPMKRPVHFHPLWTSSVEAKRAHPTRAKPRSRAMVFKTAYRRVSGGCCRLATSTNGPQRTARRSNLWSLSAGNRSMMWQTLAREWFRPARRVTRSVDLVTRAPACLNDSSAPCYSISIWKLTIHRSSWRNRCRHRSLNWCTHARCAGVSGTSTTTRTRSSR